MNTPNAAQWFQTIGKLADNVGRIAAAGERIAAAAENIAAAFQTADTVDTKPELPGVTVAED